CSTLPKRMVVYAAIGAFFLPFGTGLGAYLLAERFVLWGLVVVMFCELMVSILREEQMSFDPVVMVLFAGFVLPMLFTSLIRIDMMESGPYLLLMVFIVAFASDSFAYFAGMFLGKHKLAPRLSPKKTIEGSAGGFLGTIVCMLIYGIIMSAADHTVNYPVLAAYGYLGSLAGQLGDLAFSAIKRLHGVKDYSHIIPGHGGVLDRFDSMLFIAPLIELLMMWVPAVM
ncbi:MAG: phosphatidate cytidylyltransferase, partial [Oscillospiraceae bacterium]|nr:phosphatidate cytidylyltransferase [Oscillospiraceae bacterium]